MTPAFKARRRRWIHQWRHLRRPGFARGCEWCMGHAVVGQVLLARADSSEPTIQLTLNGRSVSVTNRGDQRDIYRLLRTVHDEAMRSS